MGPQALYCTCQSSSFADASHKYCVHLQNFSGHYRRVVSFWVPVNYPSLQELRSGQVWNRTRAHGDESNPVEINMPIAVKSELQALPQGFLRWGRYTLSCVHDTVV
jgi:hypothetical protein